MARPQQQQQQPGFGKWLPMLCQSQGYKNSEIEDPAWDVLATAVEYKMRSLIEQAVRIAHKSYGTTTVLDANSVRTAAKVLKWQKMPRVSCRGFQFQESSDCEEPLILDDFLAEETVIPVPTVPALEVGWLTVNGKSVSKAIVNSLEDSLGKPETLWYFKSFDGFQRDFVQPCEGGSKFMKVLLDRCDMSNGCGNAPGALQSVLAIPKAMSRYLCDEYRLYLQRLLSCIVQTLRNCGNPDLTPVEKAQDKLVLSKVMQTLNEGPAPCKLTPFVFAMLCALVPPAVAEGPPEAVLITLHVLISYIQNPRVYSKPYLHQIIQAMLLTLLAPTIGKLEPSALIEGLEVRRLASEGLCYVVRNAGDPAAFNSVVEILAAVLKKQELPVTTLLGAVMGCASLGEEAVRLAVKPVARSLTQALRQINSNNAIDPAMVKCRAELTNILLELLTNTLQSLRAAE